MPITRTKQDWSTGSEVKVGFMNLTVTGLEPTPGDGMPDVYHLAGTTGKTLRRYTFTPHYGLERVPDTMLADEYIAYPLSILKPKAERHCDSGHACRGNLR